MTILVIFTILMTLVLLSTGIFLIFAGRWMPKLTKMMALKPSQPSIISKLGVWKLRTLGIFHIVISSFVLIAMAIPGIGPYLPFNLALILIVGIFLVKLGYVSVFIKEKESRFEEFITGLVVVLPFDNFGWFY